MKRKFVTKKEQGIVKNMKKVGKKSIIPKREVLPSALSEDATVAQIQEYIEEPSVTIELLESKIKNLEKVIEHVNRPDSKYKHNSMSAHTVFGRTNEEYKELKTIASHILRTTKGLTTAMEKIEKWPINVRDKMLLCMLVSSKYEVGSLW